MYRKTSGKQTTYRSPKGTEKQIDYILIKRRHLKYNKDAEAKLGPTKQNNRTKKSEKKNQRSEKEVKSSCMMMNNMRKQIWIQTRMRLITTKEDQGTDTNEAKKNPEITTEELQTAINRLQKRQIRRQLRNQCRRHQSAKTKKRLHTRGMAKNKNDTQKR